MTDDDHTKREGTPSRRAPTDATKREGQPSEFAAEEVGAPIKREYLSRGTLVGRYVILDVLGEGGMGVVYSAFDPELDRKVAIKLLQAGSGGSTSGGDKAWLVREAQALARLSHPNVVAVYDVGTLADDRVFVAMELVEGETLRDWLKTEKRGWREVVPVMAAAGAGLAAAHNAELVHRDFKPDNVIVGADGRVRVMDFGLARLHRDDESEPRRSSDLAIETRSPLSEKLTIAGIVVGTPAYMAPEIYKGVAAAAGTDQFAFGVALYEALFHARPYDKKDLQPPVSAPKPKTPPDVGVPARIQRVVMRAIAIDPAQRYPTMDALLRELRVDPNRKRLVAGIAAACVAATALVVGGAYAMSRGAAPPPCQGIAQRLGGVWDTAAKTKIEAAFTATKKSFAPQAYAGVVRALDGYTSAWTAAVTDACMATRVRREQTEEVLTLRQTCLDERLEEVAVLASLLRDADGGMVEKGDKMVFGLSPIAECANVAMLRAPGLPAPEVRDKVAALAKELAAARAQLVVGRYMPGLVASQKVVDGARTIGYEPMLAEALVVHGATLLSTGNFKMAADDFTEATYAAIRGKRDDIAANAGFSMAMVATDAGGKPAEARIWLGHAEAESLRAGVDRTLERRKLEVEGLIAAGIGDYNGAIAAHEKALAVAQATLGKDSPDLMTDELDLGTTYSRAGAYAKAVPHYLEAQRLRERSVGPDHPDIALVLSNLGAAYTHTGDAAKARDAFQRSLAIRERAYGKTSPLLVATLDNFAELVRKQGDVALALQMQERALGLSKVMPGTGHPMYHQLATDYGDSLVAAKRFADAHVLYDTVFALEDAAKSPIVPATQTGRAELAIAERDWAAATTFAQKAIAGYEAAGGNDNPLLWRPLTALARVKLATNKPAEAKPLLERAVAIAKQNQTPDDDIAPARELLAQLPH
jgi:tetratricopeptide (TPR) repeat protein